MGTPLKLNGTDGDVKYFLTTEENYLSYQIGLALAGGNRTTESSLDNLAGDTTIGTYTNTVYDQVPGTHGTALSTTTNTTNLYQNIGTAAESGTDFKRPIHWNTDFNPDAVQEMTDTNFNACVDRLISKVFTSDYPGTFKLAATAPSADYSAFLENIFTNKTNAVTTANQYSIWKRNAMTAPTAVRSMAIKRDSVDGGIDDYVGLQEMTDAEIKYSFGQRAKTRISASLIGTYLLRNSSQGSPNGSVTGTWVAKGTALDTTYDVANVDYTNNYTGDYGANYVSNSTSVFAGNYIADYTGDFTGDYLGDFTGNYIASVDYISNSTSTSTRNSTANSAGAYTGDYTGDFTGNYTGADSTRNSTAASAGAYTGNYASDYTGNYISSVNYVGEYASDSTVQYTGEYAGVAAVDYTRTSTSIIGYECEAETPENAIYGNFTGNYVGVGTTNYIGNYAGDFTGNFGGNYAGAVDSTRNSTLASAGAYTGNYTGDFTGNYVGDFVRNSTANSAGAYTGDYTGDFTGDYLGDFAGNYIGAVDYISNSTSTSTRNSTLDSTTAFVGEYTGDFTGDYSAAYVGDYTGNYTSPTVLGTIATIDTYTLYVRTA